MNVEWEGSSLDVDSNWQLMCISLLFKVSDACISLTFALHSRGMYIRSEYCDSNGTS